MYFFNSLWLICLRTTGASQKKVTLNVFLDTLMSDPPPQCLVWLPLMHRLANVENGEFSTSVLLWMAFLNDSISFCHSQTKRLSSPVFHPVECSYCHNQSMMGFRYRCQKCDNYQLCQECFWRGHASGSHSNQHQMKEYMSWVSEHNCIFANIILSLYYLSWLHFAVF